MIAEGENSKERVVYYCLLSYMFEQKKTPAVLRMHERLVNYIATHTMSLYTKEAYITDEQAKSCLIKFLYSLSQKRGITNSLRKEFEIVPEMDLLMIKLIRSITGCKPITPDTNFSDYEKRLREELGF